MKIKTLAALMVLISGATGLSTVYAQAAQQLAPSRDQALVSKQLAMRLDRQHYLNQPITPEVSRRILDMYIDLLDSEHSLFLQSEIDQFRQQYGDTLGQDLKSGNLDAAFAIYNLYRQRLQDFNAFMLSELARPLDLHGSGTLDTDREKARFFATSAEQRDFWRKQLTSQLISMTIARNEEQAKQQAIQNDPTLAQGQDLRSNDLTPIETLTRRYTRQGEQVARINSDRAVETVLNAALATYDPHSNYFAPVEAMEMNRQTTLQLIGIGVSIRPERGNEDYTRIESIVDGGPASKSGQIKSGDRITGIAQDGQAIVDVVGWPSSEIVGLIRGARGSKVTLRVQQPNAQSRLVTLVRDVIEEKDAGVQTRIMEQQRQGKTYRIGVMDIPSFYFNYKARREGNSYRSVSEDTQTALRNLKAQGIDGLVVDLRNNPGGSLEEVSRMLAMFLPEGPLVQIRDGNGGINVYQDDDGGRQEYAGPMAVLVNLASASASEIFAAAIQDYGRGLVLGSTTTGKGTAQVQMDDLAYGQATLTQRKFYRVTGGSTQNKGVIPDIELVSIYEDDDYGERKAKNALKWDTIATAPFTRINNYRVALPQLLKQSTERQVRDPQFVYLNQIRQIAQQNKDRKVLSLNLDQRTREALDTEARTLAAENARRQATGQKPYASWDVYQAALDAQGEIRGRMKRDLRPPLPEEEAFVVEAAHVLLDAQQLQPLTARIPAAQVPAALPVAPSAATP